MPNRIQEDIERVKELIFGKQEKVINEDCGCKKHDVTEEEPAYNFVSQGPEDSYIEASDNIDDEMTFELGEQEGTDSGESSDGAGVGTASMGVWDSGVARGVANQIANTKWADNNDVVRGKANPKW